MRQKKLPLANTLQKHEWKFINKVMWPRKWVIEHFWKVRHIFFLSISAIPVAFEAMLSIILFILKYLSHFLYWLE